ncbi:MAG TPA: lipopolysaccharide biosynthesis protein RfbH [Candidatus Anaerotignum merdipullorum]|nr:lipopolysaccharide biosynthesis protein RfbH [Candidatus Anaerotignum merdipullorum]
MTETQARREILEKVREYYSCFHAGKRWDGKHVPYGGRVYDEREMMYLTEAMLEFRLTAGRFAEQLERKLAAYIGVRHCALVSSGSSANLLAFHTLTSPLLGDRRICRGDEVITVAAGFPTTVAPIIQYGAIPVFVDITVPQYNVDTNALEAAYSSKTKAVMLAHTLGNPFDLSAVCAFCQKYNLWLIEDNCDAMGAAYCMDGQWRKTGSFGHLATSSFYPPHHMTMGEGGAVFTDDDLLAKILVSLRDWGRDCTCAPGQDNRCKRRFLHVYEALPAGYDHKYVYGHLGFNLKVTDLQAAVGLAQLEKLPDFVKKRRYHYDILLEKMQPLSERVILPESCENGLNSPFGFLLTCQDGLDREKVVHRLEENGIQTRPLFAGNLLRHPCFDEMRRSQTGYRVAGTLTQTDRVLRDTFWVGVYPGLTEEQLAYEGETLYAAIQES